MVKYCCKCGAVFESESNNAKYCLVCRKEIKRKYPKPYLSKPKRKTTEYKSLNDIVAELEKYNRMNGTNLTYGKYVEMKKN